MKKTLITSYTFFDKRPYTLLFLISLFTSLVFSLVVYPFITESMNAGIDPDRYGELAYGLYRNGTLSYFPMNDPVVTRGPFYPLLISILLFVSGNWYPYIIQLFQGILFALSCCLVYKTGSLLFSRKTASAAALIFALHPNLIWFTARIWVETISTSLFLSIACLVILYMDDPRFSKAVLIGFLIGIGSLTKQVFLPFVLFIPLLTLLYGRKRVFVQYSPIIAVCALLVILPWTQRNYRLTGKIVPVHTSSGMNLRMGDYMVENLSRSPLAFGERFVENFESLESVLAIRGVSTVARETVYSDSLLAAESFALYKENPSFLVKKIMVNSAYIWFLGETTKKTLMIAALNFPFLFLSVLYLLIYFREVFRSKAGIIPLLGILFISPYLPIYSIARFSTPVLPFLFIFSCAFIDKFPARFFFKKEIYERISDG